MVRLQAKNFFLVYMYLFKVSCLGLEDFAEENALQHKESCPLRLKLPLFDVKFQLKTCLTQDSQFTCCRTSLYFDINMIRQVWCRDYLCSKKTRILSR